MRATPSRLWLDHAFAGVFALTDPLSGTNADLFFDTIAEAVEATHAGPHSA